MKRIIATAVAVIATVLIMAPSASAYVSRTTQINNARTYCNNVIYSRGYERTCSVYQDFLVGSTRSVDLQYQTAYNINYETWCYMRVRVSTYTGNVTSSSGLGCETFRHNV